MSSTTAPADPYAIPEVIDEAYRRHVWTAHHWQHWLARGNFPDHPYRAYLEQKTGGSVSESYAAHKWLNEIYQPVVEVTATVLSERRTRFRARERRERTVPMGRSSASVLWSKSQM